MKKFVAIAFSLFTVLLIASCGSSIDSTDNRYKHATEEKILAKEKPASTLVEDFDFTPYLLPLENAKNENLTVEKTEDTLWWNYPKIDHSIKFTVRQPGFRVQVLATDDLDEAQQMRSDIYFKTNKNEIYITFQPPLYKVRVGDYESRSAANNLAFKLNQLGFVSTQVVADSVNLLQSSKDPSEIVPKK
ncbi:MAG: SPOR domain-containing protein [Ignavibacteriaceae bacterium]